jgi:hypothetical protein
MKELHKRRLGNKKPLLEVQEGTRKRVLSMELSFTLGEKKLTRLT